MPGRAIRRKEPGMRTQTAPAGAVAAVVVLVTLLYPTVAHWRTARGVDARVTALVRARADQTTVDGPAGLSVSVRSLPNGSLLATLVTVATPVCCWSASSERSTTPSPR